MFLGDEFGTAESGAFFTGTSTCSLMKKTTASQLSFTCSLYFTGPNNLVSLIFSRLAIVNPPKAPKFALLFK
jgi:hypothetical protein